MNATLFRGAIALLIVAAGVPVANRWIEESRDRSVAIAVDWPEVRDLAAREGWTSETLLETLKSHGAGAVLFSAVTVQDLLSLHKALAIGSNGAHEALDTKTLRFEKPIDALLVEKNLRQRGVGDLSLGGGGRTLSRTRGSFYALRDVEAEFDPQLTAQARALRLRVLCRFNRDPWMSLDTVVSQLAGAGPQSVDAVLFNSDDVPGGLEAAPFWSSWVAHHGIVLPFFEFHPAKAAVQMAERLPTNAFRAHTIPSLELKDLSPDAERYRWRRAVEERSCRILLVHASPNDSTADFLDRLDRLHEDLAARGWRLDWPRPRVFWNARRGMVNAARSLLALSVAIAFPWWGLRLALKRKSALDGFVTLCLVTIVGGSVAAALARSPWTQLEIYPFRGIKIAFLLTWIGALFVLYRPAEISEFLQRALRRIDVVAGIAILALVGYVVIRSGNASAAWKGPWEQVLRDHLENWLLVRPRFKEFAFGHPLMLFGLSRVLHRVRPKGAFDGRAWIWLGMIGQASVINTFCHLHSPIKLAYARSIIGMVIGAILGGLLIRLMNVDWLSRFRPDVLRLRSSQKPL